MLSKGPLACDFVVVGWWWLVGEIQRKVCPGRNCTRADPYMVTSYVVRMKADLPHREQKRHEGFVGIPVPPPQLASPHPLSLELYLADEATSSSYLATNLMLA